MNSRHLGKRVALCPGLIFLAFSAQLSSSCEPKKTDSSSKAVVVANATQKKSLENGAQIEVPIVFQHLRGEAALKSQVTCVYEQKATVQFTEEGYEFIRGDTKPERLNINAVNSASILYHLPKALTHAFQSATTSSVEELNSAGAIVNLGFFALALLDEQLSGKKPMPDLNSAKDTVSQVLKGGEIPEDSKVGRELQSAFSNLKEKSVEVYQLVRAVDPKSGRLNLDQISAFRSRGSYVFFKELMRITGEASKSGHVCDELNSDLTPIVKKPNPESLTLPDLPDP